MENKRQKLKNHLHQLTREDTCIAFSGGVDSSLLLYLLSETAREHNTSVYAVTFDTVLHPRNDAAVSERVAKEMGAIHQVIPVNELQEPEIRSNGRERCYYCKKALFEHLCSFAKQKGIGYIVEGTNHEDLSQYRPGIRAIRELGIISPLAEAGLTKEEIRDWAKELGISVAERPSTPCLATRLPYGTQIDLELFRRIEAGEDFLRKLGFRNVRLRIHDEVVRVELDQVDFQKVIMNQKEITDKLKELGFRYITLDLEGFRSGSMD